MTVLQHPATRVETGLDEGNACSRGSVPEFASAIYAGWVNHRRHAPHPHAFRYRLFMVYLDLAEVEQVFARRWLWSVERRNVAEFRRRDYLGDPSIPLDTAVRDCVERHGIPRPLGPIRMLTHLRYFGKSFNPVTFYYCFADDGVTLQVIVAEITNTPWKQRHAYVLPVSASTLQGGLHAWRFDKRFHVSPFLAMEHVYAWRLDTPADRLQVRMEVRSPDSQHAPGGSEFDATLMLQRQPIEARNLATALLRFPLLTLRVLVAIHWQALRLWLRGNPVHDHPEKRNAKS